MRFKHFRFLYTFLKLIYLQLVFSLYNLFFKINQFSKKKKRLSYFLRSSFIFFFFATSLWLLFFFFTLLDKKISSYTRSLFSKQYFFRKTINFIYCIVKKRNENIKKPKDCRWNSFRLKNICFLFLYPFALLIYRRHDSETHIFLQYQFNSIIFFLVKIHPYIQILISYNLNQYRSTISPTRGRKKN